MSIKTVIISFSGYCKCDLEEVEVFDKKGNIVDVTQYPFAEIKQKIESYEWFLDFQDCVENVSKLNLQECTPEVEEEE